MAITMPTAVPMTRLLSSAARICSALVSAVSTAVSRILASSWVARTRASSSWEENGLVM